MNSKTFTYTVRLLAIVLFVVPMSSFGQQSTTTSNQEAQIVAGEILVRARDGFDLQGLPKELNQQFPSLKARLVWEVSPPLKIWLLRFEPVMSHHEVLGLVNRHPAVSIAQSNHVIQKRATTPNDPNFGMQWQYINSGAGGGVVDADIDADLAWDFTTGGITPFGDTIVACIIDDGLDLNHPDFGSNFWYNHHEIPGNNQDDDGNGYVDDFRGWDADNNNDNVAGGGHGTAVTGIVGAKGDNGVGVAGVNWNVKLMIVEGGGNEAQAVAAYTYPLVMRKLYNQTNGAKGAYVVVTNASWGTDYGQPSQAPLWCAIYDSLGKYGVLSCGATANLNVNVDTQGDLPTACPSDYLISVTNMNRQDIKVTSAGYGVTTIDLGAHGQDAYTTDFGGGYGGFGGTSGATPHVTGAVALLYSAACPNMAALALSQPDSAALLMKKFILDGTDPNTSIQNNTVSGGRLNLHGAILELLGWGCSINGCYNAYALNTSQVLDTSAALGWAALAAADSFRVHFRKVGDTIWTEALTATNSLWVDTLAACTAYEFQVGAICDTTAANFSSIFTFTTDGCCTAPNGLAIQSVTPTSATVEFGSVLAAQTYNLRYAEQLSGAWVYQNSVSSPFTITGLDSCTTYAFEIQTVCDTGATQFSNGAIFQTSGCIGCEQPYCSLSGANSTEEWIEAVSIGSINNTSGNDNGYGDFTTIFSTQLAQTSTHTITLTPGFSFIPFNERFNVYIDFNQDGDFFDALENVYASTSGSQSTVNATFTIPATSLLGVTRMRVVMRYNANNPGCGPAFDYGEVEDYCVEIMDQSLARDVVQTSDLWVFPNPAAEKVNIRYPVLGDVGAELCLFSAVGQLVRQWTPSDSGQEALEIKELPTGIYILRYRNATSEWNRKLNILR